MALSCIPSSSVSIPHSLVDSSVTEASSDLVSDEAQEIFQSVVLVAMLGTISAFGTLTNVLNIICFVKQGLKDSVSISLLSLAISDMGSVVTMLWQSICFNPAVYHSDLPFDSEDVAYLTGGWFHVIFARVTSWITAFITLERCLCIAMPLKVKSIVTPPRTLTVIICIFIVCTCCVSPVYYVNNLALKFSPKRNRTIVGLIARGDHAGVEAVVFVINGLFLPFSSFFIVIICTIILVFKLQSQATWRQKCTESQAVHIVSDRDQRVTKMVVMISTLFITCFIPICFTCVSMLIEPEISIHGRFKNVLFITAGLCFVLETTNSSMNIFIYYRMSSKYRAVLRQLFELMQVAAQVFGQREPNLPNNFKVKKHKNSTRTSGSVPYDNKNHVF